ncbi:putative Nudix hydrolase [Cyphellophora attinorum]|uniref:Putative Nudix hydrolase n=1 Tax=Cyphellophora attinorum TaxID=1664694 RepID=A0A0N0NJM1_9EURO|nr:putative Nudix hydrolase [Phialophora attinorum]KPI37058.1 putative Nudix hydrolase [Phialophora attinorum]
MATTPHITAITELPSTSARWIALKKIEFIDQTNTPRTWEVAVRKTTAKKSGVDAVAIGNILVSPSKPPSTLLTAEEAAVREMKEETGYEGSILSTSPAVSSDPGMTNATLQLVMMEVEVKDGEKGMPEQRLDDGELIERVVVPLEELYARLVEYSKREKFMVAAKLYHFAAGMHFAKTSGYV